MIRYRAWRAAGTLMVLAATAFPAAAQQGKSPGKGKSDVSKKSSDTTVTTSSTSGDTSTSSAATEGLSSFSTSTKAQPSSSGTSGFQVVSAPEADAPPPKATPMQVQADHLGRGEYEVKWAPVTGAKSYSVLLSSRAGTVPLNTTPVAETRLRTPPLDPAASYGVQVIANYGDPPTLDPGPPSSGINFVTPRWRGRYRVVIAGFEVTRAHNNNPDNVYLGAFVEHYDSRGGSTGRTFLSPGIVYRDLVAGARLPYGGSPCAPTVAPLADRAPMIMWEGELVDSATVVTVWPVMLLDHGDRATYSRITNIWTWDGFGHLASGSLNENPLSAVAAAGIKLKPGGDFPIGGNDFFLLGTWQYQPRRVAFNLRAVESSLALPTAIGACGHPGVVAVRYKGLSEYGGGADYTIYLKVERLQ